jgi:hypothetical protein
MKTEPGPGATRQLGNTAPDREVDALYKRCVDVATQSSSFQAGDILCGQSPEVAVLYLPVRLRQAMQNCQQPA